MAVPAAGLLPLASPSAFARANAYIGNIRFVNPFSIWWLTGPRAPQARPDASPHQLLFGGTRSEAAAIALVLGLAAIWFYGRRLRASRSSRVDGLALLAVFGLLRCVTDTDPLTYNFVAVVIPLAVWETASLRRLPIATALTCAALALLPTGKMAFYAGSTLVLPPIVLNVRWIGCAGALAAYLTRRAFGRPEITLGVTLPALAS